MNEKPTERKADFKLHLLCDRCGAEYAEYGEDGSCNSANCEGTMKPLVLCSSVVIH